MNITIQGINQHLRFFPFHSQDLKYKQLKLNKLLLSPLTSPDKLLSLRNCKFSPAALGFDASAITESIDVGVNLQGKPVDVTTFLLTSAGLSFLYWIANFVLPDMLVKSYKDEDKKPGDENSSS